MNKHSTVIHYETRLEISSSSNTNQCEFSVVKGKGLTITVSVKDVEDSTRQTGYFVTIPLSDAYTLERIKEFIAGIRSEE